MDHPLKDNTEGSTSVDLHFYYAFLWVQSSYDRYGNVQEGSVLLVSPCAHQRTSSKDFELMIPIHLGRDKESGEIMMQNI